MKKILDALKSLGDDLNDIGIKIWNWLNNDHDKLAQQYMAQVRPFASPNSNTCASSRYSLIRGYLE